jgi:hypothetical protein
MKKILEVENYMWCWRHHDVTPAIMNRNRTGRAPPTSGPSDQAQTRRRRSTPRAGRAPDAQRGRGPARVTWQPVANSAAWDRGCHTQIAPRARESRVGGGTRCGATDRRWVRASARDRAGADRAAWTGGGRPVAVRRSAGWLGCLAPLFFRFLPQNNRFSAETPGSPPVQALKIGSHPVFTSTTSGTFPCMLQCRGEAGCAPRKRGRTSTLPCLLPCK